MTTETDNIWFLLRNWTNDSTQLEGLSLYDAVLFVLREEESDKHEAMLFASKRKQTWHEDTKSLLNEAMKWVYACRVNNENQKRMIQSYEDFIKLNKQNICQLKKQPKRNH